LSVEAALAKVRGAFPIFGDPAEETNKTG